MLKKIMVFISLGLWLFNTCGCIPLMAGAAGGAGTAVWLSGKLTQEFPSSYEETITAAKTALQSLNLDLTKETKEDTVTQLKSKYSDGREIWIDIRKVSEDSTKVEVRVGTIGANKEAASRILKRIQRYLAP